MLLGCKRGEIRYRMRGIGVLRVLVHDEDPFPKGSCKLGDSGGPVTLDEVREMLGAAGWSLEEMK